jgi:uncharacterized protein YggU (UPF0235/DUF167 family)
MYIKVRVLAGAKHEAIEHLSSDHFKISVKEPAQQNLANTRVIELIAAHYELPASKVKIINGHQSTSKLLSIPDTKTP